MQRDNAALLVRLLRALDKQPFLVFLLAHPGGDAVQKEVRTDAAGWRIFTGEEVVRMVALVDPERSLLICRGNAASVYLILAIAPGPTTFVRIDLKDVLLS